MQGPSEFGISGRLANWDIKRRLKEIIIPTLVGARFIKDVDSGVLKFLLSLVKG